MKVKCINLYNEHTQQFEDTNSWLTIGKSYIVLEVEIYPGKDVLYRLVGDNTDQSPGLYDSKQFEVISDKVPANWKITQLKSGTLNFGPAPWQKLGFWEDCYDGEPNALQIYKHEARIIIDEENSQ